MEILLDCHCHTIASGHAYSTVGEYAKEASEKGLELIAITDHGPKTPGMVFGDTYFLNLKALQKKLYGVEILTGIELNIINADGDVDLDNSMLRNLDVVIASMHDVCITPQTAKKNTKAVINAIKNPYIKIIGHLGDPAFPIIVEDIVKAAGDYHTAIEINEASCTGYRSGGEGTVRKLIELGKAKKISFTWGSDAHFHTAIGEFDNIRKISLDTGLNENDILNTSIIRFKDFIAQRDLNNLSEV